MADDQETSHAGPMARFPLRIRARYLSVEMDIIGSRMTRVPRGPWSHRDGTALEEATTPPPGEPSGPNRSLLDAGPGSSGRSIRTTSGGRRCGPRATIAGRHEPRSPPETESIP